MYCWSCGKSVQENLNYCSNCCARVEKSASNEDYFRVNNPARSVGILGLFGLGGFIFLVVSLLKQGLDPGFVFAMSALYLAALFGICFLILRQVPDRSDRPQNKTAIGESDRGAPKNFRPEITNQLPSPQEEPVSSVTENTTRTLDTILIERK